MSLCKERVIYDPRPEHPFVVLANRYWDPISQQKDGYTLVLSHGVSFHKEQWEPTLKHLFSLSNGSSAFPIREAWSIECPNHGESAVLNETALLRGGFQLIFPWAEYTYSLYLFLTQNKDINFSTRRMIAIGHSMGAVTLVQTQTYPCAPKFERMILCEPMVEATDLPMENRSVPIRNAMIKFAEIRQDVWPNTQEAYKSLKSGKAFASWDDEVLRIYVEHGLRELPTGEYPEKKEGVTLKCSKSQEVASYRDTVATRRAYDYLSVLCTKIPVHMVWGVINDAVHKDIKRFTTDENSGRKMASISRVPKVGHMLVQIAPKGLAEAIFAAVSEDERVRSKL